MMWFFAILVVLLLGGIAAVAAGRGRPLAEAYDDRPDTDLTDTVLPDRPLGADDLRRVRFPLALRGYRMAEVDALLSRLADQLEQATGDADRGARGGSADQPGEPGEPGEHSDGHPDAP